MASVASGGTADRIAARTFFKELRAGSGTAARYSSVFFGAALPFMVEPRAPAIAFFIGRSSRGVLFKSTPHTCRLVRQGLRCVDPGPEVHRAQLFTAARLEVAEELGPVGGVTVEHQVHQLPPAGGFIAEHVDVTAEIGF